MLLATCTKKAASERLVAQSRPRGTEVVVSTKKSSGKYGRFLVTIWANLEGEEVNVNEWLLSEGWVRLY